MRTLKSASVAMILVSVLVAPSRALVTPVGVQFSLNVTNSPFNFFYLTVGRMTGRSNTSLMETEDGATAVDRPSRRSMQLKPR